MSFHFNLRAPRSHAVVESLAFEKQSQNKPKTLCCEVGLRTQRRQRTTMVFSRAVRTHGRMALNSVLSSSRGICVRDQATRVAVASLAPTRNFSAEPTLVPGIGRGKTSTGLVRGNSTRHLSPTMKSICCVL